jgi:hypothetical protein
MSRRTNRTELLAGDLHLLHDLAVLHVALDAGRLPARERLEHRLGADLARAVRSSLTRTAARAA